MRHAPSQGLDRIPAESTASAAIRLVIFDCDGVLVDSEPLSLRVLVEALSDAGLTMSTEQAGARFLGKSLASTCAILSADFGFDWHHADIERMRARLYDLFRRELTAIPGMFETLDRISIPCCVASSSQPERIRLSLEVTGLLRRLKPHIFSASMVSCGKPAPDLFLHAATIMNTPPHNCLVIEDSAAGIAAAKSAGMRVFAFTGGAHAGSEEHLKSLTQLAPDHIFDDMRILPDMLDAIANCSG